MPWVTIANVRGPKGNTGDTEAWYKGVFPASNVYHHTVSGLYFVSDPSGIAGWPDQLKTVPCHIEYWVNGTQRHITVTSIGLRAGKWETFTLSGSATTFTKWRRTDTDFQRDFASGEDVLDRFLPDGRYGVTADNMSSLVGLPDGHATIGYMTRYTMDFAAGIRFAYYMAYGQSGGLFFNRTLGAAGGTHTWAGWVRLDSGSGGSSNSAGSLGLNREILQDKFTLRRGGKIGVQGKGVVALRFDDPINGLINSGVADKLKELQIPASAVHCSGSFTAPDLIALSNLGSWQTVKDWASQQGMEVWHHGGNHKDASGSAALTREIVTSLANLEASLKSLEVNKWAQPGVGGTDYDGFASSNRPELFFDHEAGKLIARGHAVASGYSDGWSRPLDGTVRDGLGHWTVDTPTALTEAYNHVDEAALLGTGLAIMLHPNNLDREGSYSTSADFISFLEYLAQLRAEGKIEILTLSGLLCADATTNWRAQIIRDSGFASGLANYTGTAGWTALGGVASTTGNSLLGQIHAVKRHGWVLGATMQLVVRVKAPSGAVVKLQQSSVNDASNWTAEQEITLTASSEWKTVRLNCCVPTNLASTDSIATRIGRVSGGAIDIDSLEYRPV